MQDLTGEARQQGAADFRALSEPTRLQILNLLRPSRRNVGEIAQACSFTSANIHRQLAALTQQGLVMRESRGFCVCYNTADDSVYGSTGQQMERSAAPS
ncbi:MAG TPA: metalloregulator ArsR/SmtB family transcription factor [Roseateles sp.]|uniref:ArsR/SmtB family transcription factor n=1 Tax=Roseateles sp. TaxID=1971397 RepID=UPI002EDA2187